MSDPILFTPLQLRDLTLRNRLVLSPLCQYQATDGHVQDWHFAHHSGFALGGLGAAFVEATAVVRDGRITHGCTGIWQDSQIEGLKRIVDLYHNHGAACGIQIGHAGRRSSCMRPWDGAGPIKEKDGAEQSWQRVGPSAIPEQPHYPVPQALSVGDIADMVDAFCAAARRALTAGFDIVEIHGAHGYLLHSFFSPVSNQRTDAYGGSREKRMKLPLEVAHAVREVWPAGKPLFYRVSSVDGVDGGLAIEDTVALATELKKAGIDVVDCSSGGMSGPATLATTKIRQGYQVPFAEAVRRDAGLATMAVGAIVDPHHAEAILRDGRADLIAMGRELMAEPHWAYRAALELGVSKPHDVLPWQYEFYLSRRAAALDMDADPA